MNETNPTPPWMTAGAALPVDNLAQPQETAPPSAEPVPLVVTPAKRGKTAPTLVAADPALTAPLQPVAPLPEVPAIVATVEPEPLPVVTTEVEVASELVDTVTVTVPRAFKLRVDNFHEYTFAAGIQEMERSLADHWYSVANGVKVYQPN